MKNYENYLRLVFSITGLLILWRILNVLHTQDRLWLEEVNRSRWQRTFLSRTDTWQKRRKSWGNWWITGGIGSFLVGALLLVM